MNCFYGYIRLFLLRVFCDKTLGTTAKTVQRTNCFGGLMKITTITSNRDFQRVYHKGKSLVSPCLVTYAIKTKNNNLRIGITTSKKVGKAVKRNHSRRLIRAAFANIRPDMSASYDIIFVARTRTAYCKSYEVEKFMRQHLTQLGVIH